MESSLPLPTLQVVERQNQKLLLDAVRAEICTRPPQWGRELLALTGAERFSNIAPRDLRVLLHVMRPDIPTHH